MERQHWLNGNTDGTCSIGYIDWPCVVKLTDTCAHCVYAHVQLVYMYVRTMQLCMYLASNPGRSERGKAAWYPLFAHALSKSWGSRYSSKFIGILTPCIFGFYRDMSLIALIVE